LTCTSDGYPEPSYTWTDSGGKVVSTSRTAVLPEGSFSLTCTATGNFTTPCSASITVSGNAGKNIKRRCNYGDHVVSDSKIIGTCEASRFDSQVPIKSCIRRQTQMSARMMLASRSQFCSFLFPFSSNFRIEFPSLSVKIPASCFYSHYFPFICSNTHSHFRTTPRPVPLLLDFLVNWKQQ